MSNDSVIAATHDRRIAGEGAPDWQPVEGLLIEEIGDEYLVLNKAAGRIHQFNHTAGIVWRGLMRSDSIDEIARAIVDRFDVPEFRARKDAERMIQQLRILKLITASGDESPATPTTSQERL